MKRREFMRVAGIGAVGAAVASPAIAQSMPELKWRMTSSFPKSLDTLYAGAEMISKQVAEMTDNRFQIQPFAAGEIVPGLQALDAASNGTVEMAHTSAYYYVGKDPTFAIYTSVPFGLNTRMQNSWWYQGGGEQLGNEFFSKFGVYGIPCGNTGCQMGGWFRKEIKTTADLSGLKFRVAGIAGQILQKLGAVPQQLAVTFTRRSRKARSMPRNGSAPMMMKSSVFRRLRNSIITLVSGRAGRCSISWSTETNGMHFQNIISRLWPMRRPTQICG